MMYKKCTNWQVQWKVVYSVGYKTEKRLFKEEKISSEENIRKVS